MMDDKREDYTCPYCGKPLTREKYVWESLEPPKNDDVWICDNVDCPYPEKSKREGD